MSQQQQQQQQQMQQQQQQEEGQNQQQKRQQQKQQEPQHQQDQRQSLRATRKCCAFCAKRGERCDGLRPRCSLCIEHNNMVCLYRRKHATNARSKTTTLYAHLRMSSGAKGPAGQAHLAAGADMLTTSSEWSTSDLIGVVSLKRYRVSPSPATGLAGMQENVFLNDYFECLGFLPLASASVVREAMVGLMLGPTPQQRQERRDADAGRLTEGRQGKCNGGVERGEGAQVLACHDRASDSSQCIMWCAIALGALVQGCSLIFVGRYLQLAQASLAECFDSNTFQTARAYLVMSVLQLFLGDQEHGQRCIAFAKSIVERLPSGVVPSDMKSMLLAEEESSRLFHFSCSSSGVGTKLNEELDGNLQALAAKAFVHETDLCSFYFIADHRMRKAFYQDMRGEDGLVNLETEGRRQHNQGIQRQWDQFQGQREIGRMKGIEDGDDDHLSVPPRSSVYSTEGINPWSGQDIHRAGTATEMCIEDSLSHLTRLLPVVERSDKCAGVAGLLFHGHMAYMTKIRGDKSACLRSIEACARILTRFPGICRYRPHTAHCVLTAAASQMWRSVYDPVRDVYNAILPLNGTPAPPLEEWSGMEDVCNNLFCRYKKRSLIVRNNLDSTSSRNEWFARADPAAAKKPPARSTTPSTPPVTQNTRETLGDPAGVVQPTTVSAEEGWTTAAPPKFANGEALPDPNTGPRSPKHEAAVPADGKVQPDVAARANPLSVSENGWFRGGTTEDGNETEVLVRGQVPVIKPKSDGVDVYVQKSAVTEEKGGRLHRLEAFNRAGVAKTATPMMYVGTSVGCNRRVGGSEVPDRVIDVAVVDCTTPYDVGFVRNGRECPDIRLTEQDFEHAAELLNCSGCPDDKLQGNIDVAL